MKAGLVSLCSLFLAHPEIKARIIYVFLGHTRLAQAHLGQGYLGSHRHDCWTALFSFGHERILTIDNTPLLMQDGDLCIFGTQRHGVPVMPEILGASWCFQDPWRQLVSGLCFLFGHIHAQLTDTC